MSLLLNRNTIVLTFFYITILSVAAGVTAKCQQVKVGYKAKNFTGAK
jgi:hypothetical protein